LPAVQVLSLLSDSFPATACRGSCSRGRWPSGMSPLQAHRKACMPSPWIHNAFLYNFYLESCFVSMWSAGESSKGLSTPHRGGSRSRGLRSQPGQPVNCLEQRRDAMGTVHTLYSACSCSTVQPGGRDGERTPAAPPKDLCSCESLIPRPCCSSSISWSKLNSSVYMQKCSKLLIFCTFRPRRFAWFHMVRGFEPPGALPGIRAQDPSRIEYSAVGCLYGLCRHGTCARRPDRNVIFSCLVVPTQA